MKKGTKKKKKDGAAGARKTLRFVKPTDQLIKEEKDS